MIPWDQLSPIAAATMRQIVLRETMQGFSPQRTCTRLGIKLSFRLLLIRGLRDELQEIAKASPDA
ncbi:hypothetical protein BH18ACT12_BH18ACT12_20680 [soil metagenome]